VSLPLTQAVTDLDQSLAVLRSLPGSEGEEPGWPRRGGLWAALGLAPLAQLGGPPPGRAPLAAELRRLEQVRRDLVRLVVERESAQATLRAVEHEARRQDEQRGRADQGRALEREVVTQRAGLGGLYAELGADAARAGDTARARRLFATAARLDPGNRARYESQLRAPAAAPAPTAAPAPASSIPAPAPPKAAHE
jgi:hypothetical protein